MFKLNKKTVTINSSTGETGTAQDKLVNPNESGCCGCVGHDCAGELKSVTVDNCGFKEGGIIEEMSIKEKKRLDKAAEKQFKKDRKEFEKLHKSLQDAYKKEVKDMERMEKEIKNRNRLNPERVFRVSFDFNDGKEFQAYLETKTVLARTALDAINLAFDLFKDVKHRRNLEVSSVYPTETLDSNDSE